MQIYFCGSIRAGRQDAQLYLRIVDHLRKHGQVLTEHVASGAPMQINPQDSAELSTDEAILKTDMTWLHQSDVIVAEVTQPSLGVGFELGVAWKLNKPTLVLFRPKHTSADGLSALVRGAQSACNWRCFDYASFDELPEVIDEFLLKIKKK